MASFLRRARFPLLGAILLCLLIAAFFFWNRRGGEPGSYPKSFDGSSEDLKQTVIVPTLDAPFPEGKSAIWCSSFQIAWNKLKTKVVGEPILLSQAEQIADRLNRAEQSEQDLDAEIFYSEAGWVNEGIVEKIQNEMAQKFPNVPRPELNVSVGAVAYAYLAASSKYEYPFFENEETFLFTDSAGKQTAVGSFGIRKKDDYAYGQLRQQVQVLYVPREAIWSEKEIPEFILDPCKTSQPNQIVLARLNRKSTLADTFEDAEKKIAARPAADAFTSRLHPRDTLLVPNMAWKVSHHFKELEGKDKRFLNPAVRGLYLDTALQTIQFRLDRSGAELASESKVFVKPGATYFNVDRPFLIYMKKRDAKHPFFVMWVDNAELLMKK
jgi:hypothetical protein